MLTQGKKTSIVPLLSPMLLCCKTSLQGILHHSCIWKPLLWDRHGNSTPKRDCCALGPQPLPPATLHNPHDLFTPHSLALSCCPAALDPPFSCCLEPSSLGLSLCSVFCYLHYSLPLSRFLIALTMSSLLSFLFALDTSRGPGIFFSLLFTKKKTFP